MILDALNLNLLRIFESVYRTGSMTVAAKELHMTQSGVSQNIKNLEDMLDLKLFDRVKMKPLPTAKAKELYEVCSRGLHEIENTLLHITGKEKELRGTIRIGLPIEFGNNVILPLLAQWGKKHPKVNIRIFYGHASYMNQELLAGKLDFAFVDSYGFDKQIVTRKVSSETLSLCASKEYLATKGTPKAKQSFFERLDYIDYVEDALMLKMWFRHHYNINQFQGEVKASLMNVQGMSRMIIQGLGVGILPHHVVARLKDQRHNLHIFKGSGNPLSNSISIAYLEGRTHGQVIKSTFDFLIEELSKS